jgi:SAM-dependent methyltransferase
MPWTAVKIPLRDEFSAVPAVRAVVGTGVAELLQDPDVPGAWTLRINGVAQSHVDIADPLLVAFDYVRRMIDVIDTLAPPGPIDVLHLGAGAMTAPRCLAAMRPSSTHMVIELDEELLSLVLHWMPLPEDGLIETVVGDAADVLSAQESHSFDVIVADVFQGGIVPAQVTTADFLADAARVLRPGGLYVANIMDGPQLDFARAQAALLCQAFPTAAVLADAGVLRGRRTGNLILVGADEGASVSRLVRRLAADPFAVRLEHGERLARFVAGRRPRL